MAKYLQEMANKSKCAVDVWNATTLYSVDNEELTLVEKSLVTDDVSSDNEKKQKSMLSVCSDFISLEEEEKENISNGGQTPEEA
ncbi:unnamed protein product [Danaus chrysippus]|uniref:(African queen) hypothetical protein n=1 Tax=Danaus chrysippus TaxID=151541 RepID=A0A8J2W0E1_9NEOP|nr:unnamed protein product [Danaus chrysippus]